MKIKSIQIENLFEIFNYDIQYSEGEDVLIITGPNGFGKTQILNIIFNLFTRNIAFFQELVFDKITILLEQDIRIEIIRSIKEYGVDLSFGFYEEADELDIYDYDNRINIESAYNEYLESRRRANNITFLEEDIELYSREINNPIFILKSDRAIAIMDSINVHFIREQRLLKKVNSKDIKERYDNNRPKGTLVIETIETYSKELKEHIQNQSQKSFLISQELDSSYPSRLIREKKKIEQTAYDKRFKALKSKQEKLKKNGLYEQEISDLAYSESDAKALFVYLNDLDQKLSVFDKLLEKLDLFTSILNERRFTYKSIHIDREKGFYFKTSKGKVLELNQLSSGEQHEVVLLYELIFNADSNVIVLIDEPEISLHVTWQKEFLSDLLKIVKLRQFQVLIATHSPSIINGRWDLVYNLEKKED